MSNNEDHSVERPIIINNYSSHYNTTMSGGNVPRKPKNMPQKKKKNMKKETKGRLSNGSGDIIMIGVNVNVGGDNIQIGNNIYGGGRRTKNERRMELMQLNELAKTVERILQLKNGK